MTQINLIPWREQARNLKKRRFALSIFAAIGAAIFLVVLIHFHLNSLIARQNQRNAFLQTQLSQSQIVLNELNEHYKKQISTEEELNFIFSLRNTSYRAVRLLDEMARVVPDAVTFNKLVREGNKITITGKAESNLQITLFMKNIAASKIFHQPDLTEISAKEMSTGDQRFFKIIVTQHD